MPEEPAVQHPDDASDVEWLVETLIALRESSGLSMGEVARRMGTSRQGVLRIERGDRDVRLSSYQRYARAIGVQLEVEIRTGWGPNQEFHDDPVAADTADTADTEGDLSA